MITNPTIETLLARRSVRAYKPEQITDEERDTILNVGVWSPTGMNNQSTRFIVVQSPEMRAKLFDAAGAFPNRGGNPFYDAPTIVLIFADQSACTPFQDRCIAAVNMQNAAASLGVASCWINCAKDLFSTEAGKALHQELCLEAGLEPVCAVILGYAAESPAPKPRTEGRVRCV